MMAKRVYSGWIIERGWGEGEAIYLDRVSENGRPDLSDEPLAVRIDRDMGALGRFLTVRYWLANAPATKGELIKRTFLRLAGLAEAQVGHAYSEITGYLWTNEEIQVGGHDLIRELRSHMDLWCRLEIEFHQAKP